MNKPFVTVGNAQGFWGDQSNAAARLLEQFPELDYLTMDYLAEVSMSIMAIQRDKSPDLGYAKDFIGVVESLVPYWKNGGKCRLISNAGGLNPMACAEACLKVLKGADCSLRVGVVLGDNVLNFLQLDPNHRDYCHLDSHQPLNSVASNLMTANAYLGAAPVVEALRRGADIVITGRVADPSMVVACGCHAFEWGLQDYPELAGGTVAGHLIECGTQVTGGISDQWLDLPDVAHIGYPVVELYPNGSCVVTKPEGTGGEVTEMTVKEQLVYEIGDPKSYLSPDVTVSFTEVQVKQEGPNRVKVTGAEGRPPSPRYKVSATYRHGWKAEGMLTIFGRNAEQKARKAGEVLIDRLSRRPSRYCVEVLGAGDAVRGVAGSGKLPIEVVLRVAVADSDRRLVEDFSKEVASLVTSGPAGTTGYTTGRPPVRQVFGYWPCLIERRRVPIEVSLLSSLKHSVV